MVPRLRLFQTRSISCTAPLAHALLRKGLNPRYACLALSFWLLVGAARTDPRGITSAGELEAEQRHQTTARFFLGVAKRVDTADSGPCEAWRQNESGASRGVQELPVGAHVWPTCLLSDGCSCVTVQRACYLFGLGTQPALWRAKDLNNTNTTPSTCPCPLTTAEHTHAHAHTHVHTHTHTHTPQTIL